MEETDTLADNRDHSDKNAKQETAISNQTGNKILGNQVSINRQLSEIEAIYQSAPVGLAYVDKNLRFIKINNCLAEINGVAAEKHIGRTLREILPEDLANKIEPLYKSVLATGKPILNLEISGTTRGQSESVERTWMVNYYPLTNGTAETAGVNVVVQEITERKKAEEALLESQRFIEQIVEIVPCVIYVRDLKTGKNLFINQTVAEALGYSTAEVIAMSDDFASAMMQPDDYKHLVKYEKTLEQLRDQESSEFEYRMRHRHGEWRWFLSRDSIFKRDEEGRPQQIIGTATDITEHKRVEEKLRWSEQRLRGLIDNLFSFVGLLAVDGTLIEINRTALAAANLKFTDVIGKKFADTFWWAWSEDVQEQLSASIERALRGETIRYDVVIRVGHNRFLTIDFQLAPMFDENNRVIHLVPSGIDISERLQLEAKLKQTTQLSIAGELAAGLAHEIKNPLAGIQGAIDILLERQLENSREHEILENVKSEIARIDDVVRSLLDRTRPRIMNMTKASLTKTLLRAVQLAAHQIAARQLKEQIKIEIDSPDAPLVIVHDAAQIEDAVLNLIANAVDAITDYPGRISVKLSSVFAEDGTQVAVIEVSDTGSGISDFELPNLFTPFYTTKESGTGLGLSAVKRVVAAHEGRCTIKSVVGQGSTFTIFLPIKLL